MLRYFLPALIILSAAQLSMANLGVPWLVIVVMGGIYGYHMGTYAMQAATHSQLKRVLGDRFRSYDPDNETVAYLSVTGEYIELNLQADRTPTHEQTDEDSAAERTDHLHQAA